MHRLHRKHISEGLRRHHRSRHGAYTRHRISKSLRHHYLHHRR